MYCTYLFYFVKKKPACDYDLVVLLTKKLMLGNTVSAFVFSFRIRRTQSINQRINSIVVLFTATVSS